MSAKEKENDESDIMRNRRNELYIQTVDCFSKMVEGNNESDE